MRKAVYILLREAQQKMGGYAVYMNYKLMHFCIKAEAAALLSVVVDIDGSSRNLEDVADVAVPEDNQFAIIPGDDSLLYAISKAVKEVHPEFGVELRPMSDIDGSSQQSEQDEKYMLCTMPAVDKNRHDAGMEYVKVCNDEATTRIDETNAQYGAKISRQLEGAKPEEIDEARNALKDVYDKHVELCKAYKERKEQEIEEAYKKYLEEQARNKAEEQEMHEAHDSSAGKRMDMGASFADDGE